MAKNRKPDYEISMSVQDLKGLKESPPDPSGLSLLAQTEHRCYNNFTSNLSLYFISSASHRTLTKDSHPTANYNRIPIMARHS